MRRSSRTSPLPGLRRMPAVLALVVIGVGLQATPAIATPVSTDCTVYWTGDVSPYWDNDENWSDHVDSDGTDSHAAAGATDVACLATAPTYRHIVVNNGVSVSVGAMRLAGVDLYTYGPLTIGGDVDSEVGLLAINEPLTKAAGSTLDVRGTFYQNASLVADGAVNLRGASHFGGDIQGDVHNIGDAELVSGARVYFSGLVNDGTITVPLNNENVSPFGGQTVPTITNKGTITAGSTDGSFGVIEGVDNQGIIQSKAGFLGLFGLRNFADGVLDGTGTFDATGGTIGFTQILRENRATLRLGPGGSFNGGFGYLTSNSGTLDLGVYTNVGDDLVNSGTVKVDVGVSARGYSQTAGSTLGSGTLYGDATISGGSIGGGLDVMGDLTLGSGATTKVKLDASGDADPITATGALRVAGALEVDAAPGAPYSHTSRVLSSLAVRSGAFEAVTSDQDDRNYTPEYDDSSVSVTSLPSQVLSAVAGGPVVQGATNQLLTLDGHGLAGLTGVTFGRSGLVMVPGSLHFVGGSSWTVRVKAAATMRTGPISVLVLMDHSEASCADCLSVVSRPTPNAEAPVVLGAGASHQSVSVTGSGFADGAAVTIAGAVVHATAYVSAHELLVTYSVPATRIPGAASMRVTNPDGGSNTCKTCASFVAGPTLDTATTIAGRRTKSQTVHLSGSGFVDGLTVSGPSGVTFTDLVVAPTGITATMTVAATTRLASSQKVTVINPASAGWGTSSAFLLTVCSKTATSCG